ncbi:hypothetical protein NL676_012717 [Syzygium grande]|nr:hypothetical protein NL676_012717 [Syzygium grande]
MRICWRKLGILHGPAFLPWRRPPYRLRRPRFATHQPSAGDPRQARGFASARQSRGCRAPDLFALNKRITHLVRAGRLGEARAAFDAAGCRNTVTWNFQVIGVRSVSFPVLFHPQTAPFALSAVAAMHSSSSSFLAPFLVSLLSGAEVVGSLLGLSGGGGGLERFVVANPGCSPFCMWEEKLVYPESEAV